MPRPRKFTEVVARERVRQHVRELYPEYEPPTEAPLLYDREAAAEDNRRAEKARAEFDRRTEKERKDMLALAARLIPVLELPQRREEELVAELGALLAEVRWEWRSRREIIPDVSLPILGGVQPTSGEMRITLEPGRRHAEKLRDWYRSLPATLLSKARVPFTEEESHAVGLVIELLAETLASLVDQYQAKPGRQLGERIVAQSAAVWLVRFMDRHAPDVSLECRRLFMFNCMRQLGIPCPDCRADPGDFNVWFDGAEVLARPAPHS